MYLYYICTYILSCEQKLTGASNSFGKLCLSALMMAMNVSVSICQFYIIMSVSKMICVLHHAYPTVEEA